jgi:NAD(P)-dependent dehydrogenase (short-subunit alcohol dehydrogenase family)
MDLNLRGKTALITGGSRGIGFAIARALSDEGCAVRLVGRSRATLEKAKAGLETDGRPASVHLCDLSAPGAHTRLAQAAEDVDILVNNAGAIPRGTVTEVDDPDWRAAWDLKVFGYINLTRMVYARMKERRRGVIVNVIGVGGERPTASYIAGGSANAALMAFTCALGGESVDHGVRVVGINPGLVATDRMVTLLQKDAEVQLGEAGRWRELLKTRPFGRAAEPEEIASVVAFMASDKASYVSGTIVTIDGGSTTRQLPL